MPSPAPTTVVVVENGTCDDDELERLAGRHPVILRVDGVVGAVVRRAFDLGVRGVLARRDEQDELDRAVRAVASGGTYVSPEVGASLAGLAGEDDLTPRECEVLRLIGLGHTSTEIAGQLGLSTRTVESHRARLLHKLRASTRADLVRAALERGLR